MEISSSDAKKVSKIDVIKSFSNAINLLVNESYLKNSMNFDYFVYDKSEGKSCQKFALEIIENIRNKLKNLPSSEIMIMNKLSGSIKLKRSTLIFLCSVEDLRIVNQKIKMPNINHVDFQHLVIFKNDTTDDKIMKAFNPDAVYYFAQIMYYEMFLYKENNVLRLSTIETMPQPRCSLSLEKINSFSNGHMKWTNKEF